MIRRRRQGIVLMLAALLIVTVTAGAHPAAAIEEGGVGGTTGGDALFAFRDVRGALVRGCVPHEGTKLFLEVSGRETGAISLMANDFSGAAKVTSVIGDARPDSVAEAGNRK